MAFVGVSVVDARVRRTRAVSTAVARQTVRAAARSSSAMGSSVAPRIRIFDTGVETTRRIEVLNEPIAPSSAASTALANAALFATIARRGKSQDTASRKTAAAKPEGVSSSDYFYPAATRDLAPMISIDASAKNVKVSIEPVVASVSGVKTSSTSRPKPFWKQSTLKNYTLPSSAPTSGDEPESLDDAKYTSYFPARRRNLAPQLKIQSPLMGGGGAYVILESTRAKLDLARAEKLATSLGRGPVNQDEDAAAAKKTAAPSKSVESDAE